MKTNKIDLSKIRTAVREATRNAFDALRNAYPNDDFYYYVLGTTCAVHRPAPCACSKQGLEQTVAEYVKKGFDKVTADVLRWSEADSPYDGFGDEHFSEVAKLFEELGDPHQRSDKENKEILEAIVQAMMDLDKEGFFGVGAERENVVINVIMPGDESAEDMIARAKRLNPPKALKTLEEDILTP